MPAPTHFPESLAVDTGRLNLRALHWAGRAVSPAGLQVPGLPCKTRLLLDPAGRRPEA